MGGPTVPQKWNNWASALPWMGCPSEPSVSLAVALRAETKTRRKCGTIPGWLSLSTT